MTARTKIDTHAETLLMEFGDTLVQFNIFEAMKHPIEDHSLFGIDLIDELVEECLQLDGNDEDISDFAGDTDPFDCLGTQSFRLQEKNEVNSAKKTSVGADPLLKKAEIMLAHLVPSQIQIGQPDLKVYNDNSSSPPPSMKLNPLPSHLKYAYLDIEQQLPVIIASNLHQEQEDKLLRVLRQHKKAIGWKLSDLPGINPSICMHRLLIEEEARPIRQQQRRMNPTILDVVKKEVTKLLVAGIIYPISDSQWVSLVQVVPKKFGITIMKNQHDELVPMWIQNNWRVYIDYKIKSGSSQGSLPFAFH
ncbi:hypothetical protein CR513_32056, partial [Mucuna pruriens]